MVLAPIAAMTSGVSLLGFFSPQWMPDHLELTRLLYWVTR